MTGANFISTGNTLPRVNNQELREVLAYVGDIDPELLQDTTTRQLVELGAQLTSEVTACYGTPASPKRASGSVETDVIMSYHNGGPDGHTSIGPQGAGVPRNVLLIAQAVNRAAGAAIYDPIMRAAGFYAAAAHDKFQLCGRALLPEGQMEGHGDELLSAIDARDRYIQLGGSPVIAEAVYLGVMATAFNPQTNTQNISYDAWSSNPSDKALSRRLLGQELTAAADLLGPTTKRGPLGALEYSVESLFLTVRHRIAQQRLETMGHSADSFSSDQLLGFIGDDAELLQAFSETIDGQSKFFADYIHYSDKAIRDACGLGIDEMFPGRLENAAHLAEFATALHAGASPQTIWHQALALAGY